jgi:hypothetical protein
MWSRRTGAIVAALSRRTEAISRGARKLARKQAIREGLIAAPKKNWRRFAKAPQRSRFALLLRQIAMR